MCRNICIRIPVSMECLKLLKGVATYQNYYNSSYMLNIAPVSSTPAVLVYTVLIYQICICHTLHTSF